MCNVNRGPAKKKQWGSWNEKQKGRLAAMEWEWDFGLGFNYLGQGKAWVGGATRFPIGVRDVV